MVILYQLWMTSKNMGIDMHFQQQADIILNVKYKVKYLYLLLLFQLSLWSLSNHVVNCVLLNQTEIRVLNVILTFYCGLKLLCSVLLKTVNIKLIFLKTLLFRLLFVSEATLFMCLFSVLQRLICEFFRNYAGFTLGNSVAPLWCHTFAYCEPA